LDNPIVQEKIGCLQYNWEEISPKGKSHMSHRGKKQCGWNPLDVNKVYPPKYCFNKYCSRDGKCVRRGKNWPNRFIKFDFNERKKLYRGVSQKVAQDESDDNPNARFSGNRIPNRCIPEEDRNQWERAFM